MADFPRPGRTVGRSTVGALLGSGAHGSVYRASGVLPGRQVALKVIHPDLTTTPGYAERFLRISGQLAAIDCAHLLRIHESGEQDGLLFVATELVDGDDLSSRLTQGQLPLRTALDLASQVAEALAAAHRAGVVHGDLKPSNVLLGSGPVMHAWVSDFGLALPLGAPGSRRDDVPGACTYLAPELLTGADPTAAGDLYALGCLLITAITGDPPYAGDDQQVAQQHLTSEIPQWDEASDVLASLNALVRTALAKDPEDRFGSADQFRDAVLSVLAGLAGLAGPARHEEPAATPATEAGVDEQGSVETVTDTPAEATAVIAPAPGLEVAPEQPPRTETSPDDLEDLEVTQARLPVIDAPLAVGDEPGFVTAVRPDASGEPGKGGRRWSKVVLLSALTLVLLGAVVAGILALQSGEEEPRSFRGTVAGPGTSQSPSLGPATGTPEAPGTPGSPSAVPTPAPTKVCQEGRIVDATVRCGEPAGIEGLRYVFSTIPDDCSEQQLNTAAKIWEIDCSVPAPVPLQLTYSTFRSTEVGREATQALFPLTSPITTEEGLLQFGPEQTPDGDWLIALTYPRQHPFGVLVRSSDPDLVEEYADDARAAALPPERFVQE